MGRATTNLAFLIYIAISTSASAGGVVAIVLANIVAIFLVRLVAKNLES